MKEKVLICQFCWQIDDIVVHERQHFINHRLFRKFDATERKGGNTDLRAIKDEVLAYIRDGSSGDRLDAALHGELYKHLFADLPTDKQQIANNIIDAVASFIDYNKSLGFLKDQESRAILVYQLAGIPLERFPEWLDAFQRYYSEREKMYTPFYKRGIDHDAIRDTFAPQEEVQDAQKKMRELSKRMLEIRGAASEIIFSLKNTSPEAKKKLSGYREEYDEILEEAKKEAKPLIQNSAVMSHADMSELFKDEKVEENEFGELRETKFTERVKAKVLIAVKDFSQDKIDDISEYINGLSGIKKSDFLQELAEVINDAVESENGGQHCRVSFSETSSFENSFACTINFSVDEEDKKSDIKEASFIVYFHSTKFDLFYDER
ncbi:MAG: hypothetical protein NT094_00325 [Candidatus Staskawiczbacteria bacterium]|nr:hypothetical protein [Candidatus Staskawiczbacteria bacterium]